MATQLMSMQYFQTQQKPLVTEAQHNADKHYLFNIDVNQKCSFLRKKITRYSWVLVVIELVLSGFQCMYVTKC